PEWWRLGEDGEIASHVFEGEITRVIWADMGDFPEFSMRLGDGREVGFAQAGDTRRYVPGLPVGIRVVEHPSKPGATRRLRGTDDNHVVRIAIEAIDRHTTADATVHGGAA